MGWPEGCHILGQSQLAHGPLELVQRLCVGLHRAVRLALYCAGCEVQRDDLVEYWQVQPPLSPVVTHNSLRREGSQVDRACLQPQLRDSPVAAREDDAAIPSSEVSHWMEVA